MTTDFCLSDLLCYCGDSEQNWLHIEDVQEAVRRIENLTMNLIKNKWEALNLINRIKEDIIGEKLTK